MPKEYDNTNRWALFRNDRKTKDTDADYTGSLNIDGAEYWVNAWKPKEKGGKIVLSGSVKAKDYKGPVNRPVPGQESGAAYRGRDSQPQTRPGSNFPPSSNNDFEDDIPF